MNKITVCTFLLLICLFGNKSLFADDLTKLYEIYQNSIFRTYCVSDTTTGIGSATLISEYSDGTLLFLTAGHLLNKSDGQNKISIKINGEENYATKYSEIPDTDCLYFAVKPQKRYKLLPLQMNLDVADGKIGCLAVGYGGSSNKLSGSIGEVDRRIIEGFTYPDEEYPLRKGLIKANNFLFGGFSGGALLDENRKLLGINIINSSNGSYYVDIRYIYNNIYFLNNGKKIPLTISSFINCTPDDSFTPLEYKNKPEIINQIIDYYNSGKLESILTIGSFLIDGKKYKFSYFILMSKSGDFRMSFPVGYTEKKEFIYIPQNGWFAVIYLGNG